MDLLTNLSLGWHAAVTTSALLNCFLGVLIGMLVGVIPGIGVLAAVSLLLPLTFGMDSTDAIIMLAGVYYGTRYGGSTASILLNLPGDTAAAVTCLDGYPMARQGKAGLALFITAIASFAGAMFGLAVLLSLGPQIASLALLFGPAEYFSLMILGLIAASTMAAGSAIKGIAMVILGLLIGLIGIDITTGTARYHFGLLGLMDGVSLIVLAMGLFGLAEVIGSAGLITAANPANRKITFRSMLPTRAEWGISVGPMLRGAGVGSFFGTLPGVGSTISSFVSYGIEKRVSGTPEKFGNGALEGVVAPEAANNAAVQTAFIPTLTLGIPGDAVMAMILGALILNGVQPGPLLITQQPELFWGLIVSFIIGNIFLLFLNIPLLRIWVSILKIPYRWLFPAIIIAICLGVFSTKGSTFEIYLVVVLGAAGYLLIVLGFSPAPLLLGFVLGPLIEENLRRALLLSGGDLSMFVLRPISAIFMLLSASLLLYILWSFLRTPQVSEVQQSR